MRYLFRGIFLAVFFTLIYRSCKSGKAENEVRNSVLHNNFFLKGKVLNVKTSGNHGFGIVLIRIDSINPGIFPDTLLKNGLQKAIYPYKVRYGKAEIYISSYAFKKGDEVTLDSDKKEVTYVNANKNKHSEKTGLKIIIDPVDIDFVKENAILK